MASSSLMFLEVESVLSPSAFIFLLSSFAREFFLQFICSSKILKWVLEFEISYGFFLSLLFSGFALLLPYWTNQNDPEVLLEEAGKHIKWWQFVAASISFVYKYYQLVVLLGHQFCAHFKFARGSSILCTFEVCKRVINHPSSPIWWEVENKICQICKTSLQLFKKKHMVLFGYWHNNANGPTS